MSSPVSGEQHERATWRCRLGIHRWTTISPTVIKAAKAAHYPMPHVYIGQHVPPYCLRCGVKR